MIASGGVEDLIHELANGPAGGSAASGGAAGAALHAAAAAPAPQAHTPGDFAGVWD
jgi:hypothetical protein